MKKIQSNELAEIEQKLDNSSLDEDTKNIIKGLITDQTFLLDLVEKLIKASGHFRTKIIQELAKALEIDTKQKDPNNPENPSPDTSSGDEDQDQSEFDSESENDNKEKEKKDPSEKKRTKRSNDEYQPVISHVHFHENLTPGDLCPECLIGRVYSFREKIIPILIGRSPLAFQEHRLQLLRCNACGEIFEPKLPKEVPKSGSSMPSAQAVLALLHYKMGVPFESISTLQELFNQNLSTSQLWKVIESAANAIEPIYNELRKKAANSKLFYTDDTTARILSHYPKNKENRKKKKRNKDPKDRIATYSSLIIGCTSDGHEIYQFHHGRQYAGENLADILINRDPFLKKPIQMKDASTMNIPSGIEVIEAKCNAHAIRKFKDLKDLYPKEYEEVLKKYAKVNKNHQMLLEKKATERELFIPNAINKLTNRHDLLGIF